jgi:hypothetical protein
MTTHPVVAGNPDGATAGSAAAPDGRLRRFYADPAVRLRIGEYLGGCRPGKATAVFVSHPIPDCDRPFLPLLAGDVWELLDSRLEAARSLWDRTSLIAHLDLEHVHFDRPWEPLADPERSEHLQRPLVEALAGLLAEHGIVPLHLVTGRGHHFVWRIGRGSRAFLELGALGTLTKSLRRLYAAPRPPLGEAVGEELGAAQQGLGKVLEALAHRALALAAGRSTVPLQLTAVIVGPGPQGRELVSLDLSQFGDPLHERGIRIPFTAYRKGAHLGAPPEVQDRPLVVLPVVGGDERAARAAMHDLDLAAAFARGAPAAIPEASRATESLIAAYRASGLAAFHARFEAVEPEPPERWPETYDRLDLSGLPLCARHMLEEPNDLLLQPAAIQIVVRTLLAQGWHPRHVAGLIASKYGRDHGWLPGIHFHDPGVRADFYVRLFAGLLAAGRDPLVDFNCQSTREKGLCPGLECGWDLRVLAGRAARLREGGSHG